MAVERTLSIIKPDAVAKNAIGAIYARFEEAGLKIVAARMMHLSEAQAGGFYAEHAERPFFKDLVAFMTSGPVVVQVLEGEGAVAKNREPWAPRTLRRPLRARFARLAESIDANAVHGSDSTTSAAREVAYFFSALDVCARA